MNYIVFDTETTGLCPKVVNKTNYKNCPHIVQLSWMTNIDEKISKKSYIIEPDGYSIPKESSDIHKITTEIALLKGLPIEDVLQEFIQDFKNVKIIVCHHTNFDINMIKVELFRLIIDKNNNNFNFSFLKNKKVMCTMLSTIHLCKLKGKFGFKYPKLEELYFFLFKKEPSLKLHNALNDVIITNECFLELLKRDKNFIIKNC